MATVSTSHGFLSGSEAEGIHSFKGIPFAAPISGENRWLPPQPAAPWSGERDATQFGSICPQEPPPNKWLAGRAGWKFVKTLWKDEPQKDDCLNLNVWTSSIDPGAKLPVMVWIHGGAFTTGSGSLPVYDGANLAKKGVVLVTLNYRLGLMGSFVAPGMFDDDFCGPNRGFLDQIAGLRWVQENIANFGGDPDNVTIFGESAGGQSIAVLVASPMTKGLFKRAIAQSGTPEFCTPVSDHETFSKDLFNALEIQPGDRSAFASLSGQDAVDAIKVARKLLFGKEAKGRYGKLLTNGPLGCAYGTEFMPVHMLESLEQGVAKDIDLMIGTVKEDGRLFPLVMAGPESFGAWLCMKYFQGIMRPPNQPDVVFERYRKAMPSASKTYIRGQIMTDSMFRRGTVKAAECHAASTSDRTYLYQFNWSSPVRGIGAMHGIDVAFCNQNLEAFSPVLGDIEPLRHLAEIVSDAWVSFAKTGVPSASGMPEWQTFDSEQRATMVFDNQIELKFDVDRVLREIWYG